MTFDANDPVSSGMVLTFDDEFDSDDVSDTGVSSGAQWADHLWYDSPNPGAVSVSNGVLSLASGGELSTVNAAGQGFAQEYGYFEIDMKVPAGVGTWPAFWMMSLNHMIDPSAPASEIDIIEGQGNQPYGYYTTLHSDTGTASDTFNPNPDFTGTISATPLSSEYARFGVLWAPNSDLLTFYFNGKAVATADDYSTTDSSSMAVLISNALGDMGWGGNAPVAGESYGPLQADYVRVYQYASQDPTAVAAEAVSPAAGQTDPTALANADGVGSGSSDTSDPPAGNSDPAPTASASGTIVSGTSGDIVSAAGNVYAIDAAGQITENGAAMATTNAVTELAYVNGTVYQEATSQNLWWSYNETTSQWTETTDPLTTTGSGNSDPAPTPSASGTIVSGTSGDIVSAAGNAYAIDAAGQITENGAAMATTNAVTELAYVDGTVYQEATSQNLWWSYNETTSQWTETTDPLTTAGSGNSDPAPTPSASGTIVSGTSGDIVSAAGNAYAIDAAGQITENGAAMATTNAVTELAYVDGTVYQEATSQNLWWSYNETTNQWTETTDPLTTAASGNSDPAPTPSASGTIVSGTSGDIVSAAGNAYAIDAAGQITENGAAMATTNAVTELAYVNGTVYQEATSQNLWWSYNETTNQWTETTDPLTTTGSGNSDPAPTPSASGTIVSGTSGDIVSAAGNAYAIDAAGQITENGAAMATTNAVTELAYVNGTVYQEATSQNLWWSYNETTNQWTETTDPLTTAGSGSSDPAPTAIEAVAPSVSVAAASGNENSAIALDIAAAQASSNLAAADLTVTVSGLEGGTLNHGTENPDGSYTLDATDLSGLTVTPAENFTGTLALVVTATDTEPSSGTAAASHPATLDVTVNDPPIHAMAPMLAVYAATGTEGTPVPLYIYASQEASDLATSDLSISISGLDGASLNHGTENADGSYTLNAAQLEGLSLTPSAGFTGSLALAVTATDTEPSSNSTASTVTETLAVSVAAPTAGEVTVQPSFSDGEHSIYLFSAMPHASEQITNFNPAEDVIDLAPLLNAMGYTGTNPIADHVVNLEATSNGGTAVMIDPTGTNPDHGTTLVTLAHVLPTAVPAADIWH